MSIKIQINSQQALERLIGGDSELEVELRKSIVQNFVKAHLKGLVADKLVQDAVSNITRQVNSEVERQLKETYKTIGFDMSWRGDVTLNTAGKEQIRREVERRLIQGQLDTIRAEVEKHISEEKLKEMIERVVKDSIGSHVRQQVRERISAIMDGVKGMTEEVNK